MLFDITNYNQSLLLFSFLIVTGLLFLILRKKLSSLLDPLAMHIFWIAGSLSFLMVFIYKYDLTILAALFFIFFVIYIFFLKFKLADARKIGINDRVYEKIKEKETKIKTIYVIITLLTFLCKKPFFEYALNNPSIPSWFLYKFVDLQGRDPLTRIIDTGTGVYFYLFSFILIFILKTWRKRCLIMICLILLIGIFSGGRSSVLSGLVNLGAFVFYFNRFFKSSFKKRLNIIGLILVGLSLGVAIIVTSFYAKDATIVDGFNTIVNRFVASGDGLEYYMLYNGPKQINSGINEYIYAVFGVYLKQFTGVAYKNIGTQLTELVVGEVSFAQGANFLFPLQAMVLGFYSWIMYVPLLSLLVVKLRMSRSSTLLYLPLSFFLCYNAFTIAADMEYGVLCLISGTLVYFAFIYPILKLKFHK